MNGAECGSCGFITCRCTEIEKRKEAEKLGSNLEFIQKIRKECSLLVLCKKELFFMKKNSDGDSITSWYPVGKQAASAISLCLRIPLSYDGGPNVDNLAVLEKALKRRERH